MHRRTHNWHFTYDIQLVAAIVLVALEFTNVFQFLTANPYRRYLPLSAYTLQFATIAVALTLFPLNAAKIKRILNSHVFYWVFAIWCLFTWGIILRIFDSQAGINTYLYVRQYALEMSAPAFMIACIILLDNPRALNLARHAVAIATLIAVAFNIFEVFRPGTFSVVTGRAAGLYVDPNVSGMALVLGCLISLTSVPKKWRELYFLLVAAAVAATFSREALLALGITFVGAALARAISVPRTLLGAAAGAALLLSVHAGRSLEKTDVLDPDNLARLGLNISDASARGRLALADTAWKRFVSNPILGEGSGTTVFWTAQDNVHSYYLLEMADHGVIGVLVLPLLLLSFARRSWEYYTVAAVYVVWGLFLHLIMSLPFSLIVLAIEAAETNLRSRRLHVRPDQLSSPGKPLIQCHDSFAI